MISLNTLANTTDRLLTVEELAERLGVKPSWVYSHVRRRSRDRIPAIRLGKYWRFRLEAVQRWLEERGAAV